MKKLLLFLLLTISSVHAGEISISFDTEGLDLNDAKVYFNLSSTNPLCSKIHIGVGGIAIAPNSIEFDGELIKDNNKITAKASYTGGGFCLYRPSEVDIHFYHKKYLYFWTTVSLISKAEWSGGILDYAELSTNQNNNLEVICEGRGKASYSMCKTYNNGQAVSSGTRGQLYIWKEHLAEIDAYYGGKLKLISKENN